LPDKYELSVAAMNSEKATYHATTDDSGQSSSQAHSKARHGKATPRISTARRWTHFPSVAIYKLKSRQTAVFIVLLFVTVLAHFYAADLKGIWIDEAIRLTIANGGLATAPFEKRHPGHDADVLKAMGDFVTANAGHEGQPAYVLLVNRILRLTHSYSVVPIVTTNLLIFLLSAVGIYLLARFLLSAWGALLSLLLYLWNGFAMVHVLQVREYPLILCLFVWNTFFFYWFFKASLSAGRRIFWWIALAHCLTAGAALYTTYWAPFFLWSQAVIALLALRRNPRRVLTVWASLGVAGLSWLPWLLKMPRSLALLRLFDTRPSSLALLLARLHAGTEHLLIGSQQTGLSLLTIYYWLVLTVLIGGMVYFALRFLHQRFEIQHLVLTTLGLLAFQIGYFFLCEPLSTRPRYFILYLPCVALLIPITLSRLLRWVARSTARRAWLQSALLLLMATAGLGQIRNNYKNPYVDHGPDFRQVYQYLASRVAPSDKIVLGDIRNLMALNYYWPSPSQIQFGYPAKPEDRTRAHPNIWIVSFRYEDIPAYRAYVSRLESLGYELTATQIISRVTVRCFQRGP
jgi:hypothetical protein